MEEDILKGPGTLILNKNIYVNNFANSILATAGSGDVLAGIIGGLIAQNIKTLKFGSSNSYTFG